MEHATRSLVVLTLLQLCRAEISEILPGTWFSANTINDGYSPKSISELFSTEPPSFSPSKPIVVLPDLSSVSPEPEVTHLSTSSTRFLSSPSSTPLPPGPEVTNFSTPGTSFFPGSPSTPAPPFSYTTTPSSTFSSTYSPLDYSQTPSLTTQWPPSQGSTLGQTPIDDQVRTFQTLQQSVGTSRALTDPTGPPNFFVIYQNAPQPIPGSQAPTTDITQRPFTPPVTPSTLAYITEGPRFANTFMDTTSRSPITFQSTPSTDPFSTLRTTLPGKNPTTLRLPQVTTPGSLRIIPGPPGPGFMPNLRIRVVAPQGSITNVKINPPTTTKAPKTKRTKRPKKNSYDGCLEACRGRKDPICTVPLASTIIDTNTLKGFPSICHLSCHNSYKKDAYEKLVDGRCGRLRTRIISVDSQKKIQKVELDKAQYSVINTGPKKIVEIAHLSKRRST